MEEEIQVVVKPDWVSWAEIKHCLEQAHAENRAKGINVMHFQWTADELKEAVGHDGVMFVALASQKVVGTSALIPKESHSWYVKGKYGYLGYDCVLPEYSGKGVYRRIRQLQEEYARDNGLEVLVLYTHVDNTRVKQIAHKNGYQYVRYFLMSNREHFDVEMAKWLNGCPYSPAYCKRKFVLSKIKAHLMKITPVGLINAVRSSRTR